MTFHKVVLWSEFRCRPHIRSSAPINDETINFLFGASRGVHASFKSLAVPIITPERYYFFFRRRALGAWFQLNPVVRIALHDSIYRVLHRGISPRSYQIVIFIRTRSTGI